MTREPMFNIPEKAPLWLAGVFILIHLLFYVIPQNLELLLLYFGILRPLGTVTSTLLTHTTSLLGHGFLHGGWGHVLMNAAMTVIFGVATIRGIRLLKTPKRQATNANIRFLLIFLFSVAIGALFQWGWWEVSGTGGGAIGASGGASGMFATMAWAIGGRSKMMQFGLGWAVINMVIIMSEMVMSDPALGARIAWAAHIGGYIGGAILAPFWVRPNSTKFSVTG